jgi:hypothetical protein
MSFKFLLNQKVFIKVNSNHEPMLNSTLYLSARIIAANTIRSYYGRSPIVNYMLVFDSTVSKSYKLESLDIKDTIDNGVNHCIQTAEMYNYLGSKFIWADERFICDSNTVKSVAMPDGGMTCAKCQDNNPYADSNQNDGSYICHKCLSGW